MKTLHIHLYRTVRTEYLDYFTGLLREKYPGSNITIVTREDENLSGVREKYNGIITTPLGFLSRENMSGETIRKMKNPAPDITVIPMKNNRMNFYAEPWRLAKMIGAKIVLGISADGKIFKLSRLRFMSSWILDCRIVSGILAVLSLPYILYLFIRKHFDHMHRHIASGNRGKEMFP